MLDRMKESAKIYSEVYGCPSNTSDSEIAMGILKRNNFEIVGSPTESDLNIIFTCVVKAPTEKRMVRRIQELDRTGKPLIVAGCMPKAEQRLVERITPESSIVGPNSIERIADVATRVLKGEKIVLLGDAGKDKLCLPRERKNRKIGIVEILNGCLGSCNYCIVKSARGSLHSYPLDKIVDEAKSAVKDGCSEIWLTSQDNGCYGLDIGSNLPELLNRVCAAKGEFTIRVGMMNPTHIKSMADELVEAYRDEKIQKFLHLPVQSGSNRILKSMNRGYVVEDFMRIVEKFRKSFPSLTLSTDIIVGFPGETEKEFQSTMELLKKIRPQKVNVSKFGARYGTEAAKMKQLPVETINERSRILHSLISS
jgi:MiaB-like tRNA modifying enzyme